MTAVAQVIRNTPARGVWEYFERRGLILDSGPAASDGVVRASHSLLKAVERLAEREQAMLNADFERIREMSDEAGQWAIRQELAHHRSLEEFSNPHERALWLFLHDPEAFRRTEEMRFTDTRRQGRMWSGFVGPWHLEASRDDADHRRFEERVRHVRDLVGLEGEPRPVVRNLLWNLGTFWLGKRKVTVHLARLWHQTARFDEIHDALRRLGGKSPGVVLAWKIPKGRHVTLPHGHRMIGLKEALIVEGDACRLDMEMVKGVLTGDHEPVDDLSPVRHSGDYSTVRVNGREFVFTGMKQKQAVGILVETWKRGEAKCRTPGPGGGGGVFIRQHPGQTLQWSHRLEGSDRLRRRVLLVEGVMTGSVFGPTRPGGTVI